MATWRRAKIGVAERWRGLYTARLPRLPIAWLRSLSPDLKSWPIVRLWRSSLNDFHDRLSVSYLFIGAAIIFSGELGEPDQAYRALRSDP